MMTHLFPSLALVVEDDRFQREILSDFLKKENIDVIQCESAEAAELVIARTGAELSLLVADEHLAGQGNGIALAEFAHEKYPQLSIVVVSGTDGLKVPAQIRFLKKPYDPSDLLRIATP
jgi:DNA-binding NtrC family response regulator